MLAKLSRTLAASARGSGDGVGYDVLAFLEQHRLAPSPTNYALGYLVTTDGRGLVAMAVDAIRMEGRNISQADVDRIMAAQSKPTKDAEPSTPDAQQEVLRHQTLKLADLAAGAAANSTEFGRDLSIGLEELADQDGSLAHALAAMIARNRENEARLLAASQEIDTLRQEVEAAKDDASRDALTGLLNRRGVMMELASRPADAPGTVALFDVDHFKGVNDRFGHPVGDRVLRAVAASLAQSCGHHQVARWGGEEFLVILDGLEPERSRIELERAREDLAMRSFRLRTTQEPLGTITISAGAASLAGVDPEAAIAAADELLYEAKRRGRNQCWWRKRGQRTERRWCCATASDGLSEHRRQKPLRALDGDPDAVRRRAPEMRTKRGGKRVLAAPVRAKSEGQLRWPSCYR
jgi:diguanylate cyclase